jgi:hypothetical protein
MVTMIQMIQTRLSNRRVSIFHGFAVVLLILCLPWIASCERSKSSVKQTGQAQTGDRSPAPGTGTTQGSVSFSIEAGDGKAAEVLSVDWKEGITVLDLLEQVQNISTKGFTFKYKGGGETAFLTSIGDMENQGGGADKKNWQFWVNGQRADRGFGVYELQPLDKVVWKFVPFAVKP